MDTWDGIGVFGIYEWKVNTLTPVSLFRSYFMYNQKVKWIVQLSMEIEPGKYGKRSISENRDFVPFCICCSFSSPQVGNGTLLCKDVKVIQQHLHCYADVKT